MAFSACDDNRAHAATGIARVVVVRIAVVVRVGKVGSGSHIGNKPKYDIAFIACSSGILRTGR